MKKFLKFIVLLIVVVVGVIFAFKLIGADKIKNYTTKSKVYITGNMHGKLGYDKLSLSNFPEQVALAKEDNLIIVGDFGLVWDENIEDEMLLDELDKKDYKILFVDGTHENFDLLNKFKVVDLYGGKAHKIRDNIFHLIRGEIYTIGGEKYLAFGGGESSDKKYREKGISYWDEEVPSNEDWQNLKNNLIEHNNYVDYVLTHTAPSNDLRIIGAEIGRNLGKGSELNRKLQSMSDEIKYKKWFHAYHHLDLEISRRHMSVYNDIIEVK